MTSLNPSEHLPVPQQDKPIKEYETRLDNKKRVVIRNPKFSLYKVQEFSNGRIELSPLLIMSPEQLEETVSLRMQQLVSGMNSVEVLESDRMNDGVSEEHQEQETRDNNSNAVSFP